MGTDLREVVETTTGRSVVAFISATHLEPDYMAESFVLDAAAEHLTDGASDGAMLHSVPTGADAGPAS